MKSYPHLYSQVALNCRYPLYKVWGNKEDAQVLIPSLGLKNRRFRVFSVSSVTRLPKLTTACKQELFITVQCKIFDNWLHAATVQLEVIMQEVVTMTGVTWLARWSMLAA
jgi:hypothetical protein